MDTKAVTQDDIKIERKADFWWVVVEGVPSYPCTTHAEALEIANVLIGGPTNV